MVAVSGLGMFFTKQLPSEIECTLFGLESGVVVAQLMLCNPYFMVAVCGLCMFFTKQLPSDIKGTLGGLESGVVVTQ